MILLHNNVWVYRNLRTHCWSVKRAGRVVMYAQSLLITSPQFVVWKKVVEKIRNDKRKTPCAYVRGNILDIDMGPNEFDLGEWSQVKFNPYHNTDFMMNNKPIGFGSACLMIYPNVYVKVK